MYRLPVQNLSHFRRSFLLLARDPTPDPHVITPRPQHVIKGRVSSRKDFQLFICSARLSETLDSLPQTPLVHNHNQSLNHHNSLSPSPRPPLRGGTNSHHISLQRQCSAVLLCASRSVRPRSRCSRRRIRSFDHAARRRRRTRLAQRQTSPLYPLAHPGLAARAHLHRRHPHAVPATLHHASLGAGDSEGHLALAHALGCEGRCTRWILGADDEVG
jgi:hypothetical protein